MAAKIKQLSGTFALNKSEPIHRWYPYIEGFSSSLVRDELDKIQEGVSSLYDPFGGCGTAPLTAAQRGIKSFYSETNPFMAYLCDVKINVVKAAYDKFDVVEQELNHLLEIIDRFPFGNCIPCEYQGFEKYYRPDVLSKLIALMNLIEEFCQDELASKLAKTSLACILVNTSNMVRRGDLRYAKKGEKLETDFDIVYHYRQKLNEILHDVKEYGISIKAKTVQLSEDAREINEIDLVDCIVTSPPYLNGTNYIRNTKLELKLLGFIDNEGDLPKYHSKGIIAGINNVSKRNTKNIRIVDEVRNIVEKLEQVAYDKRIVPMVIGYFYDMDRVFDKLHHILVNNGYLILDIGDSQFAGVHIPTHDILTSLAAKKGFAAYDTTVLRSRRSKNGMVLTQRIIRYRLHK